VIVYLLLCIVSLSAGVGILAALGLKIGRAQQWLLGPGVCLACWAIALGVGVSLGVPVRRLAVPFWVGTAVASMYGAWRTRGSLTSEAGWPLLLTLALPLGLMMFDFAQGLSNFIGGPAADGWSYVARGQQLWEMSKDTQGHFAPLYEYASHLHLARFIASALLAVFSPLTGDPGDTQAAAGYLVAWLLFVFGASCASAAISGRMRRSWILVFCALAVASRWVFGAVQIHNYDNLIAISFLPMTMGLVSELEGVNWRAAIAFGVLLAAALYSYPEMAGFVALAWTLSVARRALSDARPGVWIAAAAAAVAVAAVLLLPGARDLMWFISNQIGGGQTGSATASPGARAGEGTFPELVELRQWVPAVWGFASKAASLRLGMAWALGSQALGAVLWLFALLGCLRLFRQRRWDIATMGVLMILGALVMAGPERYSYGTYKFLLLGWWAIAWFVVAGAEWLVDASSTRTASVHQRWKPAIPAVALTLLFVALFGSLVGRIVAFQSRPTGTSIRPYRNVLDLEHFIGREPLIVSVNDDVANEWAVYFLRAHPMQLLAYASYMAFPHVVQAMQQAAAPDLQAIKYVLSDEAQPFKPDIVWREPPYALWRIPPSGTAFLRQVINPNGAERMNGRSFYWIGRGDTELDVFATSAGQAVFSGRFIRGPSLPERTERRLLVGEAGLLEKPVTMTEDGDQSFSFPVHAGENRISVRALDRPSVAAAPGNDTRPLLLGVEGLNVSLRSVAPTEGISGCALYFTPGWHAKEWAASDWLRWSDGTGQLAIASRQPLNLALQGEVLSIARPNTITVLNGDQELARWRIDDPAWTFHVFPPLSFHVEAGKTLMLRLASGAGPITQASDPRPLTIALRHLTLVPESSATPCEVRPDTPAPQQR
jgi:hypothetical protein